MSDGRLGEGWGRERAEKGKKNPAPPLPIPALDGQRDSFTWWSIPGDQRTLKTMCGLFVNSLLFPPGRAPQTLGIPRLPLDQLQPPAHLWISSPRLLEAQEAQICHFTVTSGNDSCQLPTETNSTIPLCPVSDMTGAFHLKPLPRAGQKTNLHTMGPRSQVCPHSYRVPGLRCVRAPSPPPCRCANTICTFYLIFFQKL